MMHVPVTMVAIVSVCVQHYQPMLRNVPSEAYQLNGEVRPSVVSCIPFFPVICHVILTIHSSVWLSLTALQCATCDEYKPCMSSCPKKTCDNKGVYYKDYAGCEQQMCVEGCQSKPCPQGMGSTGSSQSAF